MKIGELIKKYRSENNMSLRDFAKKCGTSHSYIAMLEYGKNSKNGEPITPSLSMLAKIAFAVSMSLGELVDACDDMPVSLTSDTSSPTDGYTAEERALIDAFRTLSPEARELLGQLLKQNLK
jgi:transcriptional regulator with XRE-family HTH domain